MKSILSFAIAVAMVAVCTPAPAQDGPIPGPAEDQCLPEAAQQIIIDFLELDEAQVTQWNELITDRDNAVQPLRDSIVGIQAELEVLLSDVDPDPYEVGDLVIQRHDLGEELVEVYRTYVEGFEGLLASEQLDRYHFIRRAEHAQPLFPPFRFMDLLPPHWR